MGTELESCHLFNHCLSLSHTLAHAKKKRKKKSHIDIQNKENKKNQTPQMVWVTYSCKT